MMGRTHILLGLSSLWLLEPWPVHFPESFALAVAGAVVGSLLPDLDAGHSLLQSVQVAGLRPLALPGMAFHRLFGHRGALHSLLALGVVALVALPLLDVDPLLWLGLLLGYESHLVGDACTRHGVPLLFPNRKRIHLLPKPLRLSTGSLAEDVLFVLFALLAVALLLRHLPMASPE